MKPVTNLESILDNIPEYIWLKRKREFYLDGFEDVDGMLYGQGEQQDFAVVFSPDRLDTHYPFYQVKIRNIKTETCPYTDYKAEYFSLADRKVQKSISETDLETIDNLSKKFVADTDNWLGKQDLFEIDL